jgi:hypothetical protein
MSDQENRNPKVKIVPVALEEEYQPEPEWKLNAINDVVVDGKVQFYAVLVKPPKPVMPPQEAPAKAS